MRIALLSWESLHSVAVGGVAAHVSELGAALARMGHEVHVFTRIAPGQKYHEEIDGVQYERCPYPAHSEFVDDVNSMCRAFVDRVFVVEDSCGPFDIVHAHDWLAANAMIWIKQGRQRRTVLTIHSTEYARCGNAFPGGRSVRVRAQERAGTYWADRVIAVSHATRREIMWMYGVPDWKASVVYNGVSIHRFDAEVDPGGIKMSLGIGPMDPMVLFAGRLEWQKGPDLLVEAIPAVLRAQPSAKFVFLGDGQMRGQLENRVRQLGVAHAVRFVGFRNGDELIRLYKACDTVCIPSRNEPFGIVVLEAWAAGKPVVVTQVGGPNEYVWHEKNGLKIFPNPPSVAWGLQTMFSHFDNARRMGWNGRRAVEEGFSWEIIARETLAIYGAVGAPLSKPRTEAVPVRTPGRPEPALFQAKLIFDGNGHTREVLAACRKVLAGAGLPPRTGRRTALVEGDWDAVWAAIRRCYQIAGEMGDVRVTTSVRQALPPGELLRHQEGRIIHERTPEVVAALAAAPAAAKAPGPRVAGENIPLIPMETILAAKAAKMVQPESLVLGGTGN